MIWQLSYFLELSGYDKYVILIEANLLPYLEMKTRIIFNFHIYIIISKYIFFIYYLNSEVKNNQNIVIKIKV